MDLWQMRELPAGSVTLHDARRDEHRTVALEAFEIAAFAVTEEQFAEVLGIPARHPRRPARDVGQRAIELRVAERVRGVQQPARVDPAALEHQLGLRADDACARLQRPGRQRQTHGASEMTPHRRHQFDVRHRVG